MTACWVLHSSLTYTVKNGRNFYGDSVKILLNIKRNFLRSTVKTASFYKGYGKNTVKWPRLRAKYSKRQFFSGGQ